MCDYTFIKKAPHMFSPDHTDPRNPANYAEDGKPVFYISPRQFEDYETPDSAIDRWIEDEGKALSEAKRLAKTTGHRVVVEEHIERGDGNRELASSVTIFPWAE